MAKRTLMKGNVAVAEAAVRAGCELFAGYPITPSTELLEHLAVRMPEEGRVFIQAENELAAINIVNGAYGTGHRAMTASSGPGISLKLEGMSYCANAEVPYVCVNVNRYGRGIGSLDGSQDSYLQSIRSGGHGDYRNLVYTPSTIQEAVDDMYEAFDMAEKYRIGVILLMDTALGQTMEPVTMPEYKTREAPLDWGVDGTNTKGLKRQKHAFDENVQHWKDKIAALEREMQRWDSYMTDDAEYVLVAFGLPGRVAMDVVDTLRKEGYKAGAIVPKIVFPFPVDAFKELDENRLKGLITIEGTDFGQVVDDVALTAKKVYAGNVPTYCYTYHRGTPESGKVVEYFKGVLNGTEKEAY